MKIRKPYSATWLLWLSLLVAAIAAVSIYFISRDPLILDARQKINAIIFAAGTFIGLCMISASAQWWMKH